MRKREKGEKVKQGRRIQSFSPLRLFAFSPNRRAGGWTLIELVMTMTVLSILTLGVVPLVKTAVKRQREQRLRDTLRTMRESIKEFHRDTIGIQCGGIGGAPPTGAPPPGSTPGGVPGGAGAQPYLDPRSKVVISDCAVFGVDNPDHYPPTLEAMVEGVNVVPRAGLLGAGGGVGGPSGRQATDNTLVSLKKKVYLRGIPVDPMTGKAEWNLCSTYDEANCESWGGENIFDVRSKSEATALNGEKYSDW